MNIKTFLISVFVVVTFITVFLAGVFHDIPVSTIIQRLLLFSLLMGALGFILGFILESWGKEILLKEEQNENKIVGGNIDLSTEDLQHDEFGSYKKNSSVNNNKSQDIDPQVAARAIQKILKEDE